MIKPHKLKKGDKVALISLSGGLGGEELFRHRVELGKKRLEEVFGLEVVFTPNALKGCEFLSANPKAKAEDLIWALKDDSIKGIISIIGGMDSYKILPYLDLDVIAKHPKIFCGFSDSTSVHFMFYKAGVQSFYGPSVMCQFAENVAMHEYSKNAIFSALFEDKPYQITSSCTWCGCTLGWEKESNNYISRPMQDELHGLEFLQGKSTQGALIGGCIDVFSDVYKAGLFEDIDWSDKILFIETSDEFPTPEQYREYLLTLKQYGVFDKINGIIVGKPKEEKYYQEYKEILVDILQEYDITIVYNVNFGHDDPITVLPYGAILKIDVENSTLIVEN